MPNLEIEITPEEAQLILGDRFDHVFRKAVHTAACPPCRKEFNAVIEVRKIWLTHLGDMIVEGPCRDCGYDLSLYIESNNFPDAYDQAMALRELKMDILKDYNGRLAG